MNSARLACGFAICLVVPLCAGCASDQNVYRGQAPPQAVNMQPPGAPTGPGTMVDSAACPQNGCDGGTCDPHHGCQCQPRHFYAWDYDAPYCNNCCHNEGPLVYPPNPTPGAVVQYPYYTCKGPDDFFSPQLTGAGTTH
jgi:hypothetical protein